MNPEGKKRLSGFIVEERIRSEKQEIDESFRIVRLIFCICHFIINAGERLSKQKFFSTISSTLKEHGTKKS